MRELGFDVLVLQDAPLDELVERWHTVEALGFDRLWLADHSGDFSRPGAPWLEGFTMLAAAAAETHRIRLGPLVANPILRSPQLLAREAHALDHLSGGRLELGIGTGIAEFDHRAMGVELWPPKERAARFAEYVALVDGLLRSREDYTFRGRFFDADSPALLPPLRQAPRPPITVGGQSPTVRRVAAATAERWNTHGPYGATYDEILAVTREQNAAVDRACEAGGRDPASLRRSLLLFRALDAWQSPDALERVVTGFAAAGIGEFVLFWPPDDQRDRFEELATNLIPQLRG